MAQEFKLTLFEKGDFKDNFGNFWCDATFEDANGEVEDHVKWVVQDPTSVRVGEKYYGHFETKKSKAGRDYLRFYREQRPEGEGYVDTSSSRGGASNTQPVKKDWQPRDDDAIRAQWAINAAIKYAVNPAQDDLADLGILESFAIDFYAMVDRVKGSSESTAVTMPVTTDSPKITQDLSGYEKAKQAHQTIKTRVQEPEEAELDAAERSLFAEEPVNLSDIPF